MFEKLIESLRKMSDDATDSKQLFDEGSASREFWRGKEAGLEDAIRLIKASEPPELDAPNEEGWWWFEINDGSSDMPSGFYLVNHNLTIGARAELSLAHFKGKWQKAIVPEGR